jgi:hypothetical protein
MMANDTLTALCREWQERLRLQDWDIEILYVPSHEIADGHRGAQIQWFAEKRFAKIKVLDPAGYRPDNFVDYDEELSVVHELVHLHLIGAWPEGTLADPIEAEEVAVHRLSEALVKLKREGVPSVPVPPLPKYVQNANGDRVPMGKTAASAINRI